MKGTALIPTSLVKRLSVAATAVALVIFSGALADDAQAGVNLPGGGSASVDVFCYHYVGANVTRLWATNASDRQLQFQIYIENRTNPQLSGWQGWRILPAREIGAYTSSFDYGALVAMRTGLIRVYVTYALWDGYRWQTVGEWLRFNDGYDLCAA